MKNKRESALLVDALGSALSDEVHAYAQVPRLIIRLIEEDAWREFETKMGKHVTHARFEDFVTTPPLDGLGTTVEIIERIVLHDTKAYALLGGVLRRPVGKHHDSDIITIMSQRGTSKAYALQKLSDEGQVDLLSQVHAGKLSPHAAMKRAGFRTPKIAIRLDDPTSAAKTILAHATPEFIAELKRLLK